jgi:ABC-type lipoprotein release transport system permease subunit
MESVQVFITIATTLLIALLAAVAAGYRASRIDPADRLCGA